MVNSDARDLDALIKTLYECMSFEPNARPDYERFRTLFAPGATILPPSDDEPASGPIGIEDFIISSQEAISGSKHVADNGFREREIHRVTQTFGSICQVFSSYESEVCLDDSVMSSRGLNALQLVWQGQRWWIISLAWDDESPNCRMPDCYLPKTL